VLAPQRGIRRGQALVESAVFFPLFLILVLGALDFGQAFAATLAAENAARQAAGYAAQHQADGSGGGGSCQQAWGRTIDVALAAASPLQIGCANVTVVAGGPDAYGKTPVTVTVTAPFRAFTPLVTEALGLTQVAGHATARGETW